MIFTKKNSKILNYRRIMKKTLLIIAAVSMMLTACSKDGIKTEGSKKGMTMIAAVQEDSKAVLEKDGTTYHFNWETGDSVYVYNPSSTEYKFKNNGTTFVNNDAEPAEGTWVATYPKKREESLYFAGQDGTLKTVADKYLLYGTATASATQTRLNFTMTPVCAVLKITTSEDLHAVCLTVDNSKPESLKWNVACYIKPVTGGYVMDRDDLWDIKYGLFYDFGGEPLHAGTTHYFIVPSNEGLYLWINGNPMNDSPKTFTAGKVYTLTYPKK